MASSSEPESSQKPVREALTAAASKSGEAFLLRRSEPIPELKEACCTLLGAFMAGPRGVARPWPCMFRDSRGTLWQGRPRSVADSCFGKGLDSGWLGMADELSKWKKRGI